jgi:hypothetical protein
LFADSRKVKKLEPLPANPSPCFGAVLHTLNPRLAAEGLGRTLQHMSERQRVVHHEAMHNVV